AADDLERDIAVEPGVTGSVDGPERSFANDLENLEPLEGSQALDTAVLRPLTMGRRDCRNQSERIEEAVLFLVLGMVLRSRPVDLITVEDPQKQPLEPITIQHRHSAPW